jgi:putative transposase
MPWTEITRPLYNRDHLRYESDMTDEAWEIIGPLLPGPGKMGRPRTTDMRAVLNAIFYITQSGC